ncbi:uncharacterized protein [Narcine bancroftii]|uniref:uncharacterized protein n=1 Tax=Narcine bancroftii TaxID=1343680 RepID=UPI003831D8C0
MQQRRTKGLIKRAKINYESKLVANIKSNCKSFYRHVKRKRLVKSRHELSHLVHCDIIITSLGGRWKGCWSQRETSDNTIYPWLPYHVAIQVRPVRHEDVRRHNDFSKFELFCQSRVESLVIWLCYACKSSHLLIITIDNKFFQLQVDASDEAVGAVLLQKKCCDDVDHPMPYSSKKYNQHQKNYFAIKKESAINKLINLN